MLDKRRMVDRYRTFNELAAKERLGVDYRIRAADRNTPIVILAPHGGWIEPGTSEIAEAIAGGDLSFYAFEALRNGPHGDYHITSHRFDEPSAIALLGKCRTSVAIHGRGTRGEAVWLGGRDTDLRDAIGVSLRTKGFEAEINEQLPGVEPANICNRTRSGQGVQLELPRSLRDRLANEADFREVFSETIRKTLPPGTLA
jgi:phage replication-related protein YjqB (UPF0714/DUF867 family)